MTHEGEMSQCEIILKCLQITRVLEGASGNSEFKSVEKLDFVIEAVYGRLYHAINMEISEYELKYRSKSVNEHNNDYMMDDLKRVFKICFELRTKIAMVLSESNEYCKTLKVKSENISNGT